MDDARIKKSLKYSIADGAFYSMMVGFGESFFSAFAIFLKASNTQIGILGSLPQALGSFSELLSNKLIRLFSSRKRLICFAALLEGLMYIPIALVFFLGRLRIFYLILFISVYWAFGRVLSPAWNSLMGDLVGDKERGSYFGKRNKIAGFASFISLLSGGYILQRFTNGTHSQYIGFAVIFALALVFRIISFIFLTRHYEPGYRIPPEPHFTFLEFIKQARFRNYGLLILYLCFMDFSVFLAGPFFAAYMLYDLKLSYITFTIINATALVVKFISVPVWGRASDQFGTKKVLSLAGCLMPLVPLLWFFSSNVFYLIIIQMYSGFVWAGFEISSLTFIFDSTSSAKRATCVAYYHVLSGIAILSGSLAGSLIVKYNSLFSSKYLLLFLVSTALRYTASFIFIPKLKEVREVEHIRYPRLILRIITTMPTMGMVYEIMTFYKRKGEEKREIKREIKGEEKGRDKKM